MNRLQGRLLHVNVAGCALFAAISGHLVVAFPQIALYLPEQMASGPR